jgi:hypothetical protein
VCEVLGRPTQFKKIKDDPVLGGCVGEMPTRDSFGIDWPTQFRKIMADEVLKSTVGEMTTVAADGKNRVQTMLPIEFANCSRNGHGYHWRLIGTFDLRNRNGDAASFFSLKRYTLWNTHAIA